MKVINNIDYCLLVIGSFYALENIETALGIIILFIQLAWLIFKLTVKIIKAIKTKTHPNISEDDIGSIVDNLESLKDTIHEEVIKENERDKNP